MVERPSGSVLMKASKVLLRFAIPALLVCVALGDTPASKASPVSPDATSNAPVLPKTFGGWNAVGDIKKSSDPAVADPINAEVLKEYGFSDFETASYTRDDGRKLTLKAARFTDASGAYGAFTFYKMPQMLIEKIGDLGASLNERVLFYRGNVLVDAAFQKLSAMSASELRELSSDLPLVAGNLQNLPGLPAYLPRESYVKNSAKYVLGPVTLAKVSAPIPADLVDFSAGAEVVVGNYITSNGEATLTLISYPTPQIATTHLQRIDDAKNSPQPVSPSTPSPLINIGRIFDKRTGPIVVVASGSLSQDEGRSLLASINYDANVTWNENTHFTKRDNIGVLIVNIFYLCGIIMGFALVIGIAFGGVRFLVRRVLPERLYGKTEEVTFISLHLSEGEPVIPAPRGKYIN
jgi:hypothetical protein